MSRYAGVTTVIALLSACGHMGATPRPLYDGPARSAQEVAVLSGPVARVDGVDVSSRAPSFALLPGCHVVTLQSQIGEGGVSGAWSADIRNPVYAFRMRAGSSYSIDVHLLPGNHSVGTANVGSVKVVAIEQDSRGKKIASIEPARTQADIEACHAWAAREYGQPEQEGTPSSEEPAHVPERSADVPEQPAGSAEEPTGAAEEPADVPEQPAGAPIDPSKNP